MGGLFGSEGGPERVQHLLALYHEALRRRRSLGPPNRRTALMTAATAMRIRRSWRSGVPS